VAEVASLLPGLSGPGSATGTATQGPDGRIALDSDARVPGAEATVAATLDPARGYEVAGSADVSVADLAPFSRLAGRTLGGALDARLSGTLLPSLARLDVEVDARARDLDVGLPVFRPLLAGAGTVTGRVVRDEAGARADGLVARFPNLSVDADVEGATTRFVARLADARLVTPAVGGPLTITGTATVGGGQTAIDVSLDGPEGILADVSGTLGATADLALQGTAPLAIANPLLGGRRLDGVASFDLALAGPVALASVTGPVRIENARLSDPSIGEALAGIGGTIQLSGGVAQVDLTGSPLGGGRVAATGTVALAQPYVADLAVTGREVVIRDPSLYEARADLDVEVRGAIAGGRSCRAAWTCSTRRCACPPRPWARWATCRRSSTSTRPRTWPRPSLGRAPPGAGARRPRAGAASASTSWCARLRASSCGAAASTPNSGARCDSRARRAPSCPRASSASCAGGSTSWASAST
jgi:translocation and assembly module TamB